MSMKLNIKGLDDLQKKLKRSQKKLEEYDGEHTIELPYSKEQWNSMTEYEKEQAIEEQKQKFIDNMIKDVFK